MLSHKRFSSHNYKTVNNNNNIKSIYIRHIISLPVGPKPDMLNSTRSTGSTKQFKSSRSISFDYTIPNTDQSTKLHLPVLEDLESQDSLHWTKIFKDIAETMSWDAKTQRSIINVCVSLNVRDTINESSSTKFLERLERFNAEKESIVTLEKKLRNTNQRNFYTIHQYKDAIVDIVTKISMQRVS